MFGAVITTLLRVGLVTALLMPATAAASGSWSSSPISGMTTHVYAPSSTSPIGEGRALLIGLHGCVQTGANLRDQVPFDASAEATGTVIALPEVPMGGVIAGCWDYYGANHDRSSRHDDDLLALVDALLADPELDIDPDQVYLAGLSSGAGEAAVMGCLAPDVFAGIGIAAGPAIGTSESQIAFVTTTAEQAGASCTSLAGAHASSFATQQVVVIAGTMDYTVAQDYARIHAEMFAALYGGLTSAPLDVTTLPGAMPQGTAEVYADDDGERITRVSMQGVGHAWPTGTGSGYDLYFVSPGGFDFAGYMLASFQANNRRVGAGPSGSDSGGGDASGSSDAGDADGTTDDGVGSLSGGDDGSGASDAAGAEGGLAGDDGSGCACRADGGARPSLAFALLALAAGRRRRFHGTSSTLPIALRSCR
ncbi:MAG: PHB depolymerase family esterase [Deltaproteobacteria bacterium]|nr:PHB depolymerase family esterase [Deltaproteobacteria bacterium]MBK8713534.1 PHB depolymerase family esterase [Deltaproteobacteria bacterium]